MKTILLLSVLFFITISSSIAQLSSATGPESTYVDIKTKTLQIDIYLNKTDFIQIAENWGMKTSNVPYYVVANALLSHAETLFNEHQDINTIKMTAMSLVLEEDEYGNTKVKSKMRYCTFTLTRKRSDKLNYDDINASTILYGCSPAVMKYFDKVWCNPNWPAWK